MRVGMGLVKNEHGVWHVRKKVPKALEAATATVTGASKPRVSWLKETLGTKDQKQAKVRAKPVMMTTAFWRKPRRCWLSAPCEQASMKKRYGRSRIIFTPTNLQPTRSCARRAKEATPYSPTYTANLPRPVSSS